MKNQTIRLVTRPSRLARWQTAAVGEALQSVQPGLRVEVVEMTTRGDRTLDRPLPEIGGKGVFTQELEAALRHGSVDAAVHSLKDLPTEEPEGVCVGAVLMRDDPGEVLITTDGGDLASLPSGAVVGTSSLRRQAQLLALRPDLEVRPIRGNVETRIRKVLSGEFQATLLAAAGVRRLKLTEHVAEDLDLDAMLPAPGQAALAVQCRSADRRVLALLQALDEPQVRAAVTAERTLLATLGGGCSAPVAAFAEPVRSGGLFMRALVASPDGRRSIRVSGEGEDAEELGRRLAAEAMERGAGEVLADV